MAKEQKIEVEGKVIDVTHDIYKVELDNKMIITARVSGKIRPTMIRVTGNCLENDSKTEQTRSSGNSYCVVPKPNTPIKRSKPVHFLSD